MGAPRAEPPHQTANGQHAPVEPSAAEREHALARVEALAAERERTLANVEALAVQRERAVAELREKLAATEKERDETTAHLHTVVDKLRWVQAKALQDGAVRPGRYRQFMYWESMKNVRVDEGAPSWRSDHDESGFSRVIASEHSIEREYAKLRGGG